MLDLKDVCIFVEGTSDEWFLQELLNYLGITQVDLDRIGGGVSKLEHVKNQILKKHALGARIVLIVDADESYSERKEELEVKLNELNLPVDQFFLLPNNAEPGDLETLLEGLIKEEHRVIIECFERYADCLKNSSELYKLPNRKQKIFSYCSALDTEPKPDLREYQNSQYWDLEADALGDLRAFLLQL